MQIKGDWQIFPRLKRPIDFLGYVFCDGYTLVRKDIKERFIRKINNIRKKWRRLPASRIVNTIMSYYGWLKHANAKNLWNKHIDSEIKSIMVKVCNENNITNPLRRLNYA